MTTKKSAIQAQMIDDINKSWAELNAALDKMSEDQLTQIKDPEGWAVKDHISHMAAWERSVLFFLQGKPRHEALGVPQSLYDYGTDDDVNAVVQEQKKGLSLSEARDELAGVHSQLMRLLLDMSDEDLEKPYRSYLPDEPGANERATLDVIYGNTSGHFDEHLGWIKTLVKGASA